MNLVRLVQSELPEREPDPSFLGLERVQIHDDQDDVGVVGRGFGVSDQLELLMLKNRKLRSK